MEMWRPLNSPSNQKKYYQELYFRRFRGVKNNYYYVQLLQQNIIWIKIKKNLKTPLLGSLLKNKKSTKKKKKKKKKKKTKKPPTKKNKKKKKKKKKKKEREESPSVNVQEF